MLVWVHERNLHCPAWKWYWSSFFFFTSLFLSYCDCSCWGVFCLFFFSSYFKYFESAQADYSASLLASFLGRCGWYGHYKQVHYMPFHPPQCVCCTNIWPLLHHGNACCKAASVQNTAPAFLKPQVKVQAYFACMPIGWNVWLSYSDFCQGASTDLSSFFSPLSWCGSNKNAWLHLSVVPVFTASFRFLLHAKSLQHSDIFWIPFLCIEERGSNWAALWQYANSLHQACFRI